jgi:hypothetical protein
MQPIRVTVFGVTIPCDQCHFRYQVPAVVQRHDGPPLPGVATVVSLHGDQDLALAVRRLLREAIHPVSDRLRARAVDIGGPHRMTFECPQCLAAYGRVDQAGLRLHTTIAAAAGSARAAGGYAAALPTLVTGHLPLTVLNNATVILDDVPVSLPSAAPEWGPVPLPDDELYHHEHLATQSPALLWLAASDAGDTEQADILARCPWQIHQLLRRPPADTTCLAALAHHLGVDIRAAALLLADLESAQLLAWPPAGTYSYILNAAEASERIDARPLLRLLPTLGQIPATDPLDPHTAVLNPRRLDPDTWLTVHSDIAPRARVVHADLPEPTSAAAEKALARAGWRPDAAGWTTYTAPDGTVGLQETGIEFPAATAGWAPAATPLDVAGLRHAHSHGWLLPDEITRHRAVLAAAIVEADPRTSGRSALPAPGMFDSPLPSGL